MQINKALLESSDITRHFMTDRERKTKKALCQLLINKGHRKYAERFWKFDFNIIDSKKHPDFTAAISFENGTIYISEGFLANPSTFAQLDVIIRHELAHNLMMHQIRMAKKLKSLGIEELQTSSSIHNMIN
jgi:predicted Zn-dependent protease